jgi:hypothetical protein
VDLLSDPLLTVANGCGAVRARLLTERQLHSEETRTASVANWPIAAVEFSDVANHVNFTTSQRSRSAAA